MLSAHAKAERKNAAITAISKISELIDNVNAMVGEGKLTPLDAGYLLEDLGQLCVSVGQLINASVTSDAQGQGFDDEW
ncbi:hypothetical protein AX045_001358 [Escherichia coli]|nr:hypothetical protein [Escherichia coli]